MKETDLLVWINEKNKIVSFHWMKDGQTVVFEERPELMAYLLQLCDRSYRFQ